MQPVPAAVIALRRGLGWMRNRKCAAAGDVSDCEGRVAGTCLRLQHSIVYGAAMADRNYKNNKAIEFNVAKNTMVANPESPEV